MLGGIRSQYDEYVTENNRRVMRRTGIATAVGDSVISIITGLALGIKPLGLDLEAGTKKGGAQMPINPMKKGEA